MGKLKEHYLKAEGVEFWREVESGALLGLPDFGHVARPSLEAIAALPVGTAICSEIAISEDGTVTALLKQLVRGWDEDVFLPLLGLVAPSIAPGSRILLGEQPFALVRNVAVTPEWRTVSDADRTPRPSAQDQDWSLNIPKPPVTWPWDIKRVLATLAAAGGGRLCLTAKILPRNARIMRTITDLRDELIATSYALPEDRAIIAAQLNCKAMLEDPALLGFEVSISSDGEHETLRNLVAMALFGTLAGVTHPDVADYDLRLLAGSRQAPDRLLPSMEETVDLLGTLPFRSPGVSTQWCVGRSAGGIAVTLSDRDRARHMYVIGGTGTGKTTLLCSAILQDMRAGEPVIVLDCHGDLAEMAAEEVPTERAGDVINADAAILGGGFAIDLLPSCADSTSFEVAADMLVSIFKGAIYGDTPEGFGPVWESYFRNALALLAAAPQSERCLASFPRVFSDPAFRRELIEASMIPSVRDFWTSAKRAGGEISLENITPYITSKLTRFISSSHAQAMFPSSGDCIDFDDTINSGKILILRCPKGILGEGLSQLAMSASLMKIRAAVMARADRKLRRPVRIYIDEFQNCRGDSLQTLLAEGRKFGASLVLANQSLGQIGGTDNNSVGAATLANVGNLITFRLGATDAIKLAPWLEAPDRWRELCRLPDFTMNARLLENGRPVNFQGLRGPLPIGYSTDDE